MRPLLLSHRYRCYLCRTICPGRAGLSPSFRAAGSSLSGAVARSFSSESRWFSSSSRLRSLRRLSRYVAIAVLSLVVLLGAGVAVTQTSWFKNWLRQKAVSQAAQYLNGELTITRLSGNVFTGIALEGVALRHEGQTVVAMDRLSTAFTFP